MSLLELVVDRVVLLAETACAHIGRARRGNSLVGEGALSRERARERERERERDSDASS